MSHSVPSDSSTIEPDFLVGPDLVEFDRRDLPIYATPESQWADAGCDSVAYDASLDRLFGEPGEIFVASAGLPVETTFASFVPAEDSLVELAGLSDGVMLPACDLALDGHSPLFAHDLGQEASLVLTLHDPWDLDPASNSWLIDHHG